jgi:hypothetical protein
VVQRTEAHHDAPNNHDSKVQPIPPICNVAVFSHEAHCDDFDDHLDGKENKEVRFQACDSLVADTGVSFVCWVNQRQTETIQEDQCHDNSVKPDTRNKSDAAKPNWVVPFQTI